MNDSDRASLAALVTSERMRQYGDRSAAYRAAGLNAATWTKIEAGQRVRDDRLIAAVRTLWPESGGDWRRVGASSDRPLSDYEDRAILGEIEARLDERKLARDYTEVPTMPPAGVSPALEEIMRAELAAYFDAADEALRQGAPDRDAILTRLRAATVERILRRLAGERPDSAADVG